MSLLALRADPGVRVTGLLTTVTDAFDRISMHGVRRELLQRQVTSLDLHLTQVALDPAASNAGYEAAMADALAAARAEGVGTVAFGDLFLADIRAYREAQMASVGMTARFPVWGRDTTALVQDFIALGFRAIVVCVDTEQLDPSFLGRNLDAAFLGDLPADVDPCGENGEFHTFVWDGPMFAAPVPVTRGEFRREARFHFIDLLPAVEALA